MVDADIKDKNGINVCKVGNVCIVIKVDAARKDNHVFNVCMVFTVYMVFNVCMVCIFGLDHIYQRRTPTNLLRRSGEVAKYAWVVTIEECPNNSFTE